MKKLKISQLPLYNSLKGLFTIGTDKDNRSVRVSLEFIEQDTQEAVKYARDETDKAVAGANTAVNNAVKYSKEETDAAVKKAQKDTATAIQQTQAATNEAVSKCNTATTNANNMAGLAQNKADLAAKATEACNTATSDAKSATTAANKATSDTNKATQEAIKATAATKEATTNAIKATEDATTATDDCIAATDNAITATDEAIAAKNDVLASLARLIPTSLSVSYLKHITLGNLSELFIKAILKPDNVMQNVMFISDNKSVNIATDGRISVVGKGTSIVHIIPTCNTALAETIAIEVSEPTMRFASKRNKMRFTQGGAIRLN